MSVTILHPAYAARLRTAASPGPWAASETTFENGAILIEDAHGEIIGWATDASGHTAEAVRPDRRHPEQIRQNAQRFALVPDMVERLRAMARLEQGNPIAWTDVAENAAAARDLLARIGERP